MGKPLEIRYVDPKELKEHPSNWRLHPQVQTDALALSLKRHGWVAPLIVNSRTGRLIDGHARLRQAIASDEPVPCVMLDVPESEEREILASLDRIGELRGVDDAAVLNLLASVKEQSGRLPAGWSEEDRRQAIARLNVAAEPPDGPVRQRQPILRDPLDGVPVRAVRGDVWQLGAHRVMCGDAYSEADVAALLDGAQPELLHLDPPYGIDYKPGGLARVNYAKVEGDTQKFDPTPFMNYRTIVMWGANHYADRLPASPCWIVWDKQGGDKHIDSSDCEMAWTNMTGPARLCRHIWDGFRRDSERGVQRYHATQKPVAVVRFVFEWAPGKTVLELFLGSGTTLLACEGADRICYGMEIDPRFVDVTLLRWEQAGGTCERIVAGDEAWE